MKEYFCDITAVSEKEWERWYHQMQPSRREKCKRLQKEEAKKQRIAADHLARTALSEYLHRPADEIEILLSPAGKPYVEGNPVYFSLSHSAERVVCALSEYPVGIDIEYTRTVPTAVQKRICTEKEWKYLSSAKNEQDRTSRFILIWTRKEAVFKASGDLPRRDRETDVLNLPKEWNVSTRTEGRYTISVAERQKL